MFYPQLVGYGLFWFVIGFAAVAVLQGLMFARVFRKYAPATAAAVPADAADEA